MSTGSVGNVGSVWLGGETTSRGVLRTRRAQGGDVAGLLVSAGAGLAVLLVGGSTMVAFLAAAGVVAVGAAVCVPWEPVRWVTGGSSVRGWVAARAGFTWRRLHGLTRFSPGGGVAAPAGVGSVTSTDEPVGGLVVGVTEPDRAADRRGRGRYLVTVVESQGDPARLRGRAGAGWSAFLEFLGSEVSLASHVSTVTSVTDWDPTDHVWLARQDLERVADPDATLVASYAAVVDEVARRAAAQRTWVVLRFPVTAALREHGEGEDGLRRAAAEQTVAAVERAAGLGLLMRPWTPATRRRCAGT
ncbi:hypothetical protein D5R93_02300 [Actinomyces lilanjuaniae]|uniref:PrgI family protein n=1 Tax=Actinomyces lilanjuaniae TaxID=2321394 RepID=A0ABM6Z1V8_9ACTO|nr:hypothetical protein [Actinomyces lilanjuaniae]AYD89179.1 hypothetical protein D5R93_02300 [Actinomyces lilanjuaniae]